jgi:hypothetical protein
MLVRFFVLHADDHVDDLTLFVYSARRPGPQRIPSQSTKSSGDDDSDSQLTQDPATVATITKSPDVEYAPPADVEEGMFSDHVDVSRRSDHLQTRSTCTLVYQYRVHCINISLCK